MFTIYDLRDIIQTTFWGGMVIVLLIGWGILKANQARMRFYVAWLVMVPAGFLALILPSPKEYKAAKEHKQRYETAKAIFEQQCKNAGEKIYRTVDNVEGIMLLKIPSSNDGISRDAKHHDPMWDDATFRSFAKDGFIRTFLGHHTNELGFAYVDILQENQKDIIRYTGGRPLLQQNNPKYPARYAITFQNNTDPELRKHWVAGATIQIIDRKTNEIIAEKTSYVFETGLGNKAGARMPWAFAIGCANSSFEQPYPIFKFLIKVVKPKQVKKTT